MPAAPSPYPSPPQTGERGPQTGPLSLDQREISSQMTAHTREPQYQSCVDIRDQFGLTTLGLMTNQAWRDDPRHLLFVLSRYKFAAKMLSGRKRVLEVGCADAFATRLVQQTVEKVVAIDFDPVFVEDVRSRFDARWPLECHQHDMLSGPFGSGFDAAYSMDVLEHIPAEHEQAFLGNIVRSLTPDGVLLIGTPSLESQQYASAPSRAGHVNCKSAPDLKRVMEQFFGQVFLFSMNDEVVHTGFHGMAHYLFALGAGPRH